MAAAGDYYMVQIKPSHIDWGKYRNPTNREPIAGESYVKIPSLYARKYGLKRGDIFIAHFSNGHPDMQIKASGNGPYENGIQYAKQFEGIGIGACKAFTSWYQECGAQVGDQVRVEFLSVNEVKFTIL